MPGIVASEPARAQAPVLHLETPVRKTPQQIDVVSGHHDRRSCRMELAEDVEHAFRVLAIEVASRFVRKDDVGFASDGASNRGTLLFASRKLVRMGMRTMRKSRTFEHVVHATAQETPAIAAHAQSESDVVPYVAIREKAEILEDNPDVATKILDLG